MSLPSIFGIGGHVLLLSATALWLACRSNLKMGYAYALTGTVLLAVSMPIGTIQVAQITRGVFGDLSITTMVLLGYFLIFPATSRTKSNQLFILVVMTGILFYPTALGLGMTDPYQWGFLNTYHGITTPLLFLAALVAIMLVAMRLHNDLILACIVLAMGACMIGALESKNMWDYLIDPLLLSFGLFRIGIQLTKQLVGRDHA